MIKIYFIHVKIKQNLKLKPAFVVSVSINPCFYVKGWYIFEMGKDDLKFGVLLIILRGERLMVQTCSCCMPFCLH